MQDDLATVGEAAEQDGLLDRIRRLVLGGEFPPGAVLPEAFLAQEFDVSRTPIREALKALSAQQIVRYERNRGYFVAQFSADDIAQLYWLRSIAENELLRTVETPTAAGMRKLRALNARIGQAESFERLSLPSSRDDSKKN